jgi:hypothetical protein
MDRRGKDHPACQGSNAETVIVRFVSHPQVKNAYVDTTSLPAFQAVAKYLGLNAER